jgi:hypothetical protein
VAMRIGHSLPLSRRLAGLELEADAVKRGFLRVCHRLDAVAESLTIGCVPVPQLAAPSPKETPQSFGLPARLAFNFG